MHAHYCWYLRVNYKYEKYKAHSPVAPPYCGLQHSVSLHLQSISIDDSITGLLDMEAGKLYDQDEFNNKVAWLTWHRCRLLILLPGQWPLSSCC